MAEVDVERTGAVLTVILNRPDVLNALDEATHRHLRGALKEAADTGVRAVVLTGAGRAFCVGQDLAELGPETDVDEHLRTHYHPNVRALRALDKPVLAAVTGPAAGAGLSLACACDLRIAADSASFVPAFVSIGLVPDSGSSFFLSRLLGPVRAWEWMTSGRRLGAEEALAWGLVSEVVAAGEVLGRAQQRAAELAQGATRAIAMTKRLFERAPVSTLDEQLELEAQLQAAAAGTEDFREGVAAFREKRRPRFSGR